jgi:AcrR family transcriptional regulator
MSNVETRRGRPVDRQARAERRAQILDAAHQCFSRKGFHATTTAEISAEAQISVAGLYQYFPSKDDLLQELIEQDLTDSIALVEAIMAGNDFFDSAESILLQAMQDERQAAMARIRLEILAEASRSPRIAAILASSDQRFTAAMVRAITLAQTKGQVAADVDPFELAVALTCLADGLFGRLCLPPYARGPFVTASVQMIRRAAAPTKP